MHFECLFVHVLECLRLNTWQGIFGKFFKTNTIMSQGYEGIMGKTDLLKDKYEILYHTQTERVYILCLYSTFHKLS